MANIISRNHLRVLMPHLPRVLMPHLPRIVRFLNDVNAARLAKLKRKDRRLAASAFVDVHPQHQSMACILARQKDQEIRALFRVSKSGFAYLLRKYQPMYCSSRMAGGKLTYAKPRHRRSLDAMQSLACGLRFLVAGPDIMRDQMVWCVAPNTLNRHIHFSLKLIQSVSAQIFCFLLFNVNV